MCPQTLIRLPRTRPYRSSARAVALGFALATALGAALNTAAFAQAPDELTLEEILERNRAAMGGAEVLGRVESVWRQRNERTITVRKKPHFHLVVLLDSVGGIRYAEGFDGRVAWEQIGDGPRQEVGERARTALWHTTQFPSALNPLQGLPERGHDLELLGRETIEEQEYLVLRLTLSDGFEREYFLNAASFRIERSRDSRRHHAYEEEEQPIESLWSDFREVDGVWLPFTTAERNIDTGEILSGGTMLRIRLNVQVPDEDFGLDGSYEAALAPLGEG